ncbi:hypothetical protein [Flavobacterium sp. GSA192]|uniref:hypothetical protein n=1 Tax=Flavobacterium sp. GSA192 TaxID=2576304 RepID=UPI00112629DA|nr:hypothetical protein [Flavobacterium sp. GSA192]
MAVLKKIKSATLVEAIVATVLIVIVFIVASLILNNLVLNTYSKNTHAVENRLNELEYEIQNKIIELPYEESYKDWQIEISTVSEESEKEIVITATNQKGSKKITRHHGNLQN